VKIPANGLDSKQEPGRFSFPRPLWIGLAAVVLIVVAIGLQFGLPAYRQQIAIQEIERLGGSVKLQPRGPKWLRSWVGDERMRSFDDVIEVSLAESNATDGTMRHVGRLTKVQSIWLDHTRVTDAGIAELKGLKDLELVSLNGTQVGDIGAIHFGSLRNLWILSLGRTKVTDTGVCEFRKLPRLKVLVLYGTDIGDSTIDCLKELTGLENLDLRATGMTNAGFDRLRNALPGCRIQPMFQFE